MDGETFQSWKIENFSCWDNVVHGKCIKSPLLYFSFFKHMELYPRGASGFDELLMVRFCDVQKTFSGGQLSFIAFDASVICTLQVARVGNENFLYSPLGPKYYDVIDRIENGAEDQLTVQFVPPRGKIYEQCMCTTIEVLEISFEIDRHFMESSRNPVVYSSYSYTEEGEGVYFKIYRKKQLTLEPFRKDEKAVLFKTSMRWLSNKDDVVKYEKNKHVFRNAQPWTFYDSPEIEELVDKSNALMMSFKIIKSEVKKRYNNLWYQPDRVTVVRNSHVCVPEEKSSKDQKSFSSQDLCDSLTKPSDDTIEKGATSKPMETSVSAVAKELTCLYQDQDFSDLQIECGAISFPVHKNILSARSPVFKCLLSCDMQEAASGKVDVTDIDAPTVARFLYFLYSGTVEDLESESAIKLYYAADKYQVPTLKKECADFLYANGANVSISNVCDILSLADKHQDDELLSAARDFILCNCKEVTRSEEWKSLMRKEPMLVAETMTHFAAQEYIKKSNH